MLVHEATHLRIRRSGITYDTDKRERIERICVQQQVAFLQRVPCEGGEGLAIAYEHAVETPWWTDADHRERIERLVAENDLPKWLLPLFYRRRSLQEDAMPEFVIEMASLPDRELLVAELWYGESHVAELSKERGNFVLSWYAPVAVTGQLSFDSLLIALQEMKVRLLEHECA